MVTTTRRGFYRKSEGISVRFQENTCILVQKIKNLYASKSENFKGIIARECLKTIPIIKNAVFC